MTLSHGKSLFSIDFLSIKALDAISMSISMATGFSSLAISAASIP